ncbi:MAG: PAS domain-containing sensor histidine kinase [Burkholderiales bacterium]|nr:PAS domain-containing sensor histidine kinase [Burkholderiales bacterium]
MDHELHVLQETGNIEPAPQNPPARDVPQTRESEQLSHQFFEAASDAVAIIDTSGSIVRINTQTEKLFGYRRDELLNQPIEMLVPERLRTQHAEHHRAYFRNPLPWPMGSNFVAVGLRKDGSEFPIDLALSCLPTASGLYVASTIRDITAQRQLEDDLRQHARALEDADHHKNLFLTTLAHELRSPLAAIAYSAEFLRRHDLSAVDRAKATDIVFDELRLVRHLVNDLSEVSLIQRGELLIEKTATDMGEVARLAIAISRPLIERRGHTLETAIPPLPIRVMGDAARLTQIVTNLLTNAARYTPQGGRIRLALAQEDSMVVLRIKDNGIGMPQEMLKRVFELFTRLDAARQKYASGLGIGLAYVKRLVEIHGGSVQACSEGEGHGSELVVRLPLAEDLSLAEITN